MHVNVQKKCNIKDYLTEGKNLRKKGKVDQAIEVYFLALQYYPHSVATLWQLAEVYESRQEFSQAFSCRQQIVQLQPNNALAIAELAKVLREQGKIAESISTYQRAIALQQDLPARVYSGFGNALKQAGQTDEAIVAYQKAITLNPSLPHFYVGLAQCYTRQGLLDQAIQEYTIALKLDFSCIPALQQLAEIYESRHEFNLAFPYRQRVVELKPHNGLVLAELARVMKGQDKKQELISTYQKAITLQAKQPRWVYKELADVLAQNAQVSDALAVYQYLIQLQQVQELDDDSATIFYSIFGETIIQLCIRKNQFSEAAIAFKKAFLSLQKIPWNPYYLATLFAKQNQFWKAVNWYKKSIQVKPYFCHKAYLNIAESLLTLKQKDEALTHCLAAIKMNPRDGKGHKIFIEWLHQFSDSISKSELDSKIKTYTSFTRSLDLLSPNSLFPYLKISQVLLDQGQLSEAIQCNQNALYNHTKKLKPEFTQDYWYKGALKEPEFMIIGVMKCGTTALYDYMVQHPQILPCVFKEPNDCGLAGREAQNKQHLSYYLSLFPPRTQNSSFITGEASTTYMYTAETPKLVKNFFPETKLIVILRNPVKRFISHYNYLLKMNGEKRGLEEVIVSELDKYETIVDPLKLLENVVWGDYLLNGLYVYFLQRWMSIFPKNQFLILKNEDLSENTGSVMRKVFDFLDVRYYDNIQYLPKNKGSYPSLEKKFIDRLSEFYKPYNQKLEEFLGQKFNWD